MNFMLGQVFPPPPGLGNFFELAEQFHTQNDPAYCGPGTIVMALNSLGLDPQRMWKAPWRWFSEEMLVRMSAWCDVLFVLDCCVVWRYAVGFVLGFGVFSLVVFFFAESPCQLLFLLYPPPFRVSFPKIKRMRWCSSHTHFENKFISRS